MACLDTTALIDLLPGKPTSHHRVLRKLLSQKLAAGELALTTRVCEAELRVGIYRVRDANGERDRVDSVLTDVRMLELDAAAAERFAMLKARLFALGRPVGDMDLLIAAIALVNGESLVTRNPRHFADVPGLVVEAY